MQNLNIKMNSITYALKAKNILQNYGISSYIKRNPRPKQSEGCGYYLVVSNANCEDISLILKKQNVPFVEMEWQN